MKHKLEKMKLHMRLSLVFSCKSKVEARIELKRIYSNAQDFDVGVKNN